MVKDYNHYTIFGWMINRLHLKGTDLKIYAVIYSFSQDGKSEYKGSNSYLADFTGAGERTISRILADLEERKFIEKTADNASTGRVNGWKAIPLEQLESLGIIQIEEGCQNGDPPSPKWQPPDSQNGNPTVAKMATPINKVDKLLSDSNLNDINLDIEKERKKEIIDKSISLKFSKMTDEELIEWGETPLDLSKPDAWDLFAAYDEEVKKRKQTAGTKWKGKIIKSSSGLKRLQSHAEIMDENNIKGAYRIALENFLRHCYLNGHLVTNDKLLEIIVNLDLWYGKDYEEGKIKSLKRAISGGYYDIREKAI